ncbi:zinc finger BED domain-containing protein RICESLEEPER 2-like protein [Tanacetum coccineum]
MSDNSTKAQCKHCFGFLSSGSNSTLRNHIKHPHCEALKTVPKAGQSSMSRDGSIFVFNSDVITCAAALNLCFNVSGAELLIETISTDLEFFDDGHATKAKQWFNESLKGFDVLGFWKAKETLFPVLSRMTMDIISVQPTSLASEFAFSTSGKILDSEVLENEAIALSDEEIAQDGASHNTRSNESGSGGEEFDYDLTLSE